MAIAHVHHDIVADLRRLVLHHEQADVTVDALGLAAGHEAVDVFDLHGNG